MENLMGNKKNNTKKNLLLLITFLILSLLISEIIVRIFYPQNLSFNVTQWDPYVGFVNIPNIKGYTETEEYKMFIKINSHGLRDKEYPYQKPPNTLRIGVFGDSTAFGQGVQNNETYPKLLENLLQADDNILHSGFNIEVINFGIGKTGTSQQLAFYQKEGKKYDLDIVLLGFHSGNDFGENNYGGVFYIEDGKLVHNPLAYSSIRRIQKLVYHVPFYHWLATHSYLVNLLKRVVTNYDDMKRRQENVALNVTSNNGLLKNTDIRNSSDNYDYITYKLLEEFKKETHGSYILFIIVHLPAPQRQMLDEWHKLFKKIKNENFKILDLAPIFSRLPTSPYYFNEGHMTSVGNQMVASSIYEYILPDVLSLISRMQIKDINTSR